MYIMSNYKLVLMMNIAELQQLSEQPQKYQWLSEVLSSVSTLLWSTEQENTWEDERKNILMVQNELKHFQQEAETIYFKYFDKLRSNEIQIDNSGACCTIADIEIEKAFKKFVKNSDILKEYTVIWEETGITEWTNEGNNKYIFIDPIDCTHWFKKWQFWSGSIIGVYHWWKNVAWMTLDISNKLSYHHTGDEYEIFQSWKIIKSRKPYWLEYEEYEDTENEWIKKWKESKDLYVYTSCKWENWKKWDGEKFNQLFIDKYWENNIEVWTHRSITALNSALWFNKWFIHYGTSAHDFSHMVWFTQACWWVMMDHNWNIITEMDVEQVEKNYKKWMKLKKKAKRMQELSKKFKLEWDKEEWYLLSVKSQKLELEYRNYIYTFPIIVAKDYKTAKGYADLLKDSFWRQLDNMQTEALPQNRKQKLKEDTLISAIRKGIYS